MSQTQGHPGPFHVLKTWPDAFQAMWIGRKRHELRKNDRNFTTDDLLILREYDPTTRIYSGRTLFVVPTYITPGGAFGLPDDMCIMSVREIARNYNYDGGPEVEG